MAIAPPPLVPGHETGEKGPWSRRVGKLVDELPGRVHDWFEELSLKQKALYVGGGGAVAALLVAGGLVMSGGSGDTEDRGVPPSDGDKPVAVDTNPGVGTVDELSPQAESPDLPPCGNGGRWFSMLVEEEGVGGELVGANLGIAGDPVQGKTWGEILERIADTCALGPSEPGGRVEIRFVVMDPRVFDSSIELFHAAAGELAKKVPGEGNVVALGVVQEEFGVLYTTRIEIWDLPSGSVERIPGQDVSDTRLRSVTGSEEVNWVEYP